MKQTMVKKYNEKACDPFAMDQVMDLLEGSEHGERFAQFDKKIINIASAIASLPDQKLATQLYQLALTMNETMEN